MVLVIFSAEKEEDILCIQMLADIGEKIRKGVALLINIFNPELLILGVYFQK